MDQWFTILKNELQKPLPGSAAQLLMATSLRRPNQIGLPAGKAGVVILLYKQLEEVYVIFIKRAEYDGVHSGQISFPGGMHEPGDDSLLTTAIRETEEEIGISRNDITTIGTLTCLHVPVSNVYIMPVVAILTGQPAFHPDANEVAFVIEARISDIINPTNRKRKMIRIGDFEIEAPYFDVSGQHIWGATAMMLSEFLEVLNRAGL